jgi:DNA-binding transcriptional ArsR family regulator
MLSSASGHLSKLADGDLVAIEKQGRHHYLRLSGADVTGSSMA